MDTILNKSALVSKSLDVMQRLESVIKETIGLACMDPESRKGEVLAEVAGSSGFCYHLETGYKIPIHTAAPCKAMLAYLDDEASRYYIDKAEFIKHTPRTIISAEDYYKELASVRAKGYSIDVSEEIEGCHCVGVPIFDDNNYPIGALWTTGVSGKIPVRDFARISKKLKNAALEISARLSTSGKKMTPEYTRNIIEKSQMIMANHLDSVLDMKELAEKLFVGYSWFRKTFKEQTGLSPNQFHMNLRINQASELLRTTAMTVREVSEHLGFKSQNHFSALFKKKTGQSPDHFRKSV